MDQGEVLYFYDQLHLTPFRCGNVASIEVLTSQGKPRTSENTTSPSNPDFGTFYPIISGPSCPI